MSVKPHSFQSTADAIDELGSSALQIQQRLFKAEDRCVDYAGKVGALKAAVQMALEHIDGTDICSKSAMLWFLRKTLADVS